MRKAFTLLELLAVIAIITLLIGILLPAVQGVREGGRRTQCLNRQRNLAVALLNYENTRGSLPGWRDLISTSATAEGNIIDAQASWIYCILPHIEQTSLYDQLKALSIASTIPPIPLLHCPSLDVGPQSRGTHYVVNGGAVDEFHQEGDTTVDGNIANGPFLDRANIIAYSPSRGGRLAPPYFNPKHAHAVVRESDISKMDGTAYTLLTSENCQRGYWISDDYTHFYHNTAGDKSATTGYWPVHLSPDGTPAPGTSVSIALAGIEDHIEGSVAFCWPRVHPTGQPLIPEGSELHLITYPLSSGKDGANMYQGFTGAQEVVNPPHDPVYGTFAPIDRTTRYNYDNVKIPVYLNLFNRKTFPSWYQSARPSSMHVGIVIASFCDGNVRGLSTDMYEMTFVQLMTVSDALSDAGRALPVGAGEKNFLEGQLFDPGVL